MIRIDHIAFGFVATDEQFVYSLYTNWDSFCRTCVEEVVEECLSVYDKEKVLHEIELLDLDLGGIPEKDFYREFPWRLREELQKALPLLNSSIKSQEKNTGFSRLENLLFYLEHGYPKVEWSDKGFNLTEELEWIAIQPATFINKISKLCLSKEHILRRLVWQADNEAILLRFYAAAITEPAATRYEKRRFMVMLLDAKPDIPVSFVHNSKSDTELREMGELLDTFSVRQIMETEAREHTEVDLPPYWHCLYEWLIRYYPFNGLAIFGSKNDFIRHLHHRLLTFIHKQTYSFYFSKEDLTVGFLLEVFGPAYYMEVLNAIYNLQPRHADGSPVDDNYFSRELYRIFLSLSLLQLPLTEEEKEMSPSEKEDNHYVTDIPTLVTFLKDTRQSYADKQMFFALFLKKSPKILTDWLQMEAVKEDILLSALTEITDMNTVSQLLTSVSFTAMEIMEQVRSYLRSYASEIDWLNRITTDRLDFAFRKAVLLWIGNGCQNQPEADGIRQLLRWMYWIITNDDNENAVELLVAKLFLEKNGWKESARFTISREELSSSAYIRKLQTILSDRNVPETAKRRLLSFYLEQYAENYTDAILLLHKENLLVSAVVLINQFALEEIIRQSVVRIGGKHLSVELLTLLHWLLAHEQSVATYLQDRTTGLKVQLLVWLAKAVQSQADVKRTVHGNIYNLLVALFIKEHIHSIMTRISNLNIAQTQLESYRNIDKGFINGLEKGLVSSDNEQELLQCMTRVDFYQASVLLQITEWMHSRINDYPFLNAKSIVFSAALSQALLLYMQDAEKSGRNTLTEKEIVDKFLSYLHFIFTGKSNYQDNAAWTELSDKITSAMKWADWQDIRKKEISDILSDKNMGNTVFAHQIISIVEKQPERLLAWLEKDTATDISPIVRIAEISDVTLLKQWIAFLPTVAGFEHPDAFRQLTAWLIHLATDRRSVSDMISALLLWIRETDWRKQTSEQMEDYFFSRLSVKNNTELLPIEALTDNTLPENTRKKLFHRYIRFHPKELLDYIRQSVSKNIVSLDIWLVLLNIDDWMRLATNLSLVDAELLQQIMGYLFENYQTKEADLQQALATYLIGHKKKWIYNSQEETVRSFVQSLPIIPLEKAEVERKKTDHIVKQILNIMQENYFSKEALECFPIKNAGLCLLSPWIPRLFAMLGYMNEDRKTFKDTSSQIRAIFLLQYLTCLEEKEYLETDLVFNRLLVALPMHVPLPRRIELTDMEKQIANSLLEGIKGNWYRMSNTSVIGIVRNFILRNGRLEQQEKEWLLTVDDLSIDVLLDSITWPFKLINHQWMEKYIRINWHERQ